MKTSPIIRTILVVLGIFACVIVIVHGMAFKELLP